MIDKTTEGFTATRDEIDGMLRNLCAYALSEPDPLQRYDALTHQQVLFDGVVAGIRRERGRALADLAIAGVPLAQIAEQLHLGTPQRVKALIEAAGASAEVAAAAARVKPPSRTRRVSQRPAILPAVPVAETRTLTPQERVALGLPAQGPIPRAATD